MVRFPGLGIFCEVNPIAVELFGFKIYSYAVCIVFGILMAFVLCYKSEEKFKIANSFTFDTLFFAVIFGFIGARIYYVLFNLGYYIQNPLKILSIRDGGLALYGGFIAGAIVVVKRCKRSKVNILDFFDYIVPFVSIAQSIGRWGNFFNQEAYGTETTNFLRMGINTTQGYIEVHPTFLYESIATFLIFIFLIILQKRRKFSGEIFYTYLILYSTTRMFIENLRVDSLMFFNLKISQLLSFAIFVFSSIMLLKKIKNYIHIRRSQIKLEKKVNKNNS